jgi:hypothetical protein
VAIAFGAGVEVAELQGGLVGDVGVEVDLLGREGATPREAAEVGDERAVAGASSGPVGSQPR